MSSPVSTGVLRIIRRIYSLGASGVGAVERLDEASPIQFVHDVSRQAELGAAASQDGGYWLNQAQHAHVGAGTLNSHHLIWANLANFLLGSADLNDLDLWLLESVLHLDTNVLTVSNVGLLGEPPGKVGAFPRYSKLISTWKGGTPLYQGSAGTTLYQGYTASNLAVSQDYVRRPFRIFRDTSTTLSRPQITFHSVVTGAATLTFSQLFWVGPRGSGPPGMS